MDEIKIWRRTHDNQVTPIQSVDRVAYENDLEEILVAHSDMLEDELALVGRQFPTATGKLDLLGIDADGRLVVFELKRGTLTRDAVAQAIDYASWLDSLHFDDLADRITNHSGHAGTVKVPHFENWYAERFSADQMAQLRPTRIVLVGLGVEESVGRMARWLNTGEIDVSAITFHGFSHGDDLLLARQVEAEPPPSGRRRPGETPKAKVERTLSEIQSRPHAVLFEQVRALIEQLRLPMTDVTARAEPLGIGWGPSTQRGVAAYRLAYTLRGVDAASPSVRLWLSERAVHHAKRHFDATTPTLGLIEDPNGRHHRLSREEDALFPNARQLLIESTQHWDKLKDDVRGLIQAVNDNWYEADSTEQGESQ